MNDHMSRQAFQLLRFGFIVAPLVAGLDKFFNVLTDWEKYLAPFIPSMTGLSPSAFMTIVGVVEIVAAIVVAVKPKLGGLLVAGWLLGIIVNLIAVGGYLDIALRDVGLMIGALALYLLARASETQAPAEARH
ncbi:MAG: hypothetical protein KY459_03095 [Acidobacteria bacterium]|nr:hypothetical protein [Acidobacteriota bacterium]